MRLETAIAQLRVDAPRRLVETEFQDGDVRTGRGEVIGKLELIDLRLHDREFIERFRVMREHEVGLVPEDLRRRAIALRARRKRRERGDRFAPDLCAALRRERIETPAIEPEHTMQDVPTVEGLGDVRMSHGA